MSQGSKKCEGSQGYKKCEGSEGSRKRDGSQKAKDVKDMKDIKYSNSLRFRGFKLAKVFTGHRDLEGLTRS